MTVAELGRRVSSAEFTDWLAYAEVEPFGPVREDERAGVVASVIANVYRDRKRKPEPFVPGDFFASAAPDPVDLGTKILTALGSAAGRRRPRA